MVDCRELPSEEGDVRARGFDAGEEGEGQGEGAAGGGEGGGAGAGIVHACGGWTTSFRYARQVVVVVMMMVVVVVKKRQVESLLR